MRSFDRPNKNRARNVMLWDIPKRKSILDLPGPGGLSIYTLMSLGIIDTNTPQQWVECNRKVFESQKAIKRRLNLTNCVHHNGLLEKYQLSQPVDLINADMESGFTRDLGLWFERLRSPLLMKGCRIVLTTTRWSRNNEFRHWFSRYWRHDAKLKYFIEAVHDQLNPKHQAVSETELLLRCSLSNYEIEHDATLQYDDREVGAHYDMIVNRLTITGRQKTPVYPTFSSIYAQFLASKKVTVEDENKFRKYFKLKFPNLRLVCEAEDQWSVMISPSVPPIVERVPLAALAPTFGYRLR